MSNLDLTNLNFKRLEKERTDLRSVSSPTSSTGTHSRRGGNVKRVALWVVGIHVILLISLGIFGACGSDNEDSLGCAVSRNDKRIASADKTNVVLAADACVIRPFPEKFPRGTYMPDMREVDASGAISSKRFSPGRDLVYVEDSRVWWESDNDGEEAWDCDHSMHKALEAPFRRLANLVCASNATLKVQEAYCPPDGTHSRRSLHNEGRALDVTCPDLGEGLAGLEILAKMCWAVGFDWVFFETPRNGGAHVHASVRNCDEK